MVLNATSPEEIALMYKKLKNKKSSGSDGISNEILKCCSPVVEEHLCKAFNEYLKIGIFPECLKCAKVIALHKKCDYSDPENYRPISLLSSLSKVFEKLLYTRVIDFFVENNLFTSLQFGFRSNHSCVHAISKITDYIRVAIDKKFTGQTCFIDLRKAFDSLDHSQLLKKLYNYGFRGPILHLMSDYLTNRWQYVFDNERNTEKLPVITGVPQGSILGPFLFLSYINDLPAVCSTKSNIAIFAEDTSLFQSGKQNLLTIQNDLSEMTIWFAWNKLSINSSKCETISFGIGKPPALKTDNISIPEKPHYKYSGVHLDSQLNFREHISYIAKKLNKFCGLMYRVRYMYPKKCLSTFYNSHAKTIISYGISIYGSAQKSDLNSIDQAQRRILRAIFFKKKV